MSSYYTYGPPYDEQSDSIDYRKWFKRIFKHWKWLILSVVVGIGIAWYVYQSATRIYEFKATIMLKGTPSQLNIFERNYAAGNPLSSFRAEYQGYLNQSIILGLRSSVQRTVETLDFNVHFYTASRFRNRELFPDEPYTVDIDITHPQALGVSFEVLPQTDGSLLLKAKGEKVILHDFAQHKHLRYFPEINEELKVGPDGKVTTEYCSFIIRKKDLAEMEAAAMEGGGTLGLDADDTEMNPVFFRFVSNNQLTSLFRNLDVSEVEKYATMATVTLRTPLKEKGRVFLNRHLDRWLQDEMEQKNLTAVNTLHFINQQLEVTRDSLELVKSQIEEFRRNNDVILPDEQLGEIYTGRKTAEEELTTLKNTRQRLDQLKEYIAARSADAELMAPVVMGLNSDALSAAVLKLMDIRSRLYSLQTREKESNPYVDDLKKEERTQLAIIDEAIRQLEHHNAQAIGQTEARLQAFVNEQNQLPAKEQEYLELQRVFDLNNKMYNLLRTRKVETEVMKAAATADSKVLEYATEPRQVAPSPLILLAGVAGGLALPVAIIVLLIVLDVKVHDDEDVARLVPAPILGHIIRNDFDTALVSCEHPSSPITETFRALRSSFNYILKGKQPQVVVVSSSASGEGKSFVALNLAGLYAIAGKKTVLLGFDLRKHGLKEYLDIPHNQGITELIIGTRALREVAYAYRENLDVITAGKLPPNPSDLIESENTRALIEELKHHYEMIVVDTSPVGLVTDALPLAVLADINLYVVRPGHTLKKSLAPTFAQLEKSGISNIGMVMNSVDPAEHHVSYGYGYTPSTPTHDKK